MTNQDTHGKSRDEKADGDGDSPKGWYSRGYIPHCDGRGLLQSVTFRLVDSLPRQTLVQMQHKLAQIPAAERNNKSRQWLEYWLDQGIGCCVLRHPKVAQSVQDSLWHFHRIRYRLAAWCIMPNHVHVLLECRDPLGKIIQGWKSFTSRWILAKQDELRLQIPNTRRIWMREYWDRYVRDENHLTAVVRYIHNNPVKAGLCQSPQDWPWSSYNWNREEKTVDHKNW